MTQISKKHLEFVGEAKKAFEDNPIQETHRNGEETLIALRMGADRDCIMVYRLDGYVGNFVQQLQPVRINSYPEVSIYESKHTSLRF
ncbi:hypothetical protein BME96_12605 [Virgibacillus halodenitrificans]|uniref:Uncharacterized protein n=1 Tax=Virgibacillus halodenitrificans TaxID=1482 RepID=A0AAC9J3B1_VIRHA|nr:hypothetical protein [Virgibacillus halodenitrificans]APC48980.1 hypothetical protein BME96_12605 [Virgibacillus halodenitrificans]